MMADCTCDGTCFMSYGSLQCHTMSGWLCIDRLLCCIPTVLLPMLHLQVVKTDEGTGECEWESGDNRKFKVCSWLWQSWGCYCISTDSGMLDAELLAPPHMLFHLNNTCCPCVRCWALSMACVSPAPGARLGLPRLRLTASRWRCSTNCGYCCAC